MEELRVKNNNQLERLLQSQPRNSEEEKERQQRILELSLEPELVQKLEKEQTKQGMILEKKQKELEATKDMMKAKMEELDISKNNQLQRQEQKFWSFPRKQFEAMLFRKKADQIERSKRHIGIAS